MVFPGDQPPPDLCLTSATRRRRTRRRSCWTSEPNTVLSLSAPKRSKRLPRGPLPRPPSVPPRPRSRRRGWPDCRHPSFHIPVFLFSPGDRRNPLTLCHTERKFANIMSPLGTRSKVKELSSLPSHGK